jgi:hypothetical protein
MKYSSKNSKKTVKIIPLSLIILTAGVGAYTWFHIHNVRVAQKQNGRVANVQSETSKGKKGSTNSNGTAVTPAPKDTAGSQPVNSGAGPSAPTGQFVSNHRPGQNGTDTSMQSICTTTPGATCDITFTSQDGVVKNLGSKKTDNNGAAIWDWDINGANLASGTWTVTATASLNVITSSTTDDIKLEVQ